MVIDPILASYWQLSCRSKCLSVCSACTRGFDWLVTGIDSYRADGIPGSLSSKTTNRFTTYMHIKTYIICIMSIGPALIGCM